MSTTQKGPNLLDQWFFVQKVVSDRKLSRCAVACAFHLVDYYNNRLGRAWPSYVIDMENAVIVDVEATPTRISKEVDATETMMERVEERFALKPDHLAGDVAYGVGGRQQIRGRLEGRQGARTRCLRVGERQQIRGRLEGR